MPETSKMNPIGKLFSDSWRRYREQFTVLIKISVVPGVFIAIGAIFQKQESPSWALLGFLFSLAGGILAVFASAAIIIALEEKTDFNESYRKSTRFFWPSIWVSILVAFATIGGFVMLIVPGIILSTALILSRFTLIIENRRGLDALTQSRAYIKGYWWATLGRYILMGLCFGVIMFVIFLPISLALGNIAAAVAYAAILLFITPFSFVYLYEIYKNLVALKPEVQAGKADAIAGGKKFLAASAIVGVVAPIIFIIGLIGFLLVVAKPYLTANPIPTEDSTSTAAGMHCGGFTLNPPTCPNGYHCQINSRIPDTGGVCVIDAGK